MANETTRKVTARIGATASMMAVACGDNALPECAGKQPLRIYQYGEPQLLVLKTSEDWEPLVGDAPYTTLRICLEDDEEYSLVAVCVTDGKAEVQEVFATVGEVSKAFVVCDPNAFEHETVTVTGTMLQHGHVSLGDDSTTRSVFHRGPMGVREPRAPRRRGRPGRVG